MSPRAIIKRYSLIINLVKGGQKPSAAEIREMLISKGFKNSEKTFTTDLRAIRDEFGIEIVWDRYANGYFIDFENSLNIKDTLKYFEMANSALIMIDTLKEGKSKSNYISMDSSENLTGIEYMEPLIAALKSNQVVSFDYFNFQKETTSSITIRPYLLKEYQNRWFLYGENKKYDDFRIYGLERISNLVLTDFVFEPKKDHEPVKDFENIIGITLRPFMDSQPVQDIVLSMSREQSRYFKTLPWHQNHIVIIDQEDEFRVKLQILPNYELLQQLLRYCDKITVLEPQWLRERLKEILSTSALKY